VILEALKVLHVFAHVSGEDELNDVTSQCSVRRPSFTTTCTVFQKNVPPLTCYTGNLDIHDPITIIFGRSVIEKVGNKTILCFPTSPI